MKLNVTTHKLSGYRETQRTAQRLADQAARLVSRSVSGRMPNVQITLTTPRGVAELVTSAEVELAGEVDKRTQSKALKQSNRYARELAGQSVPLADGGVLIVVNIEQHANPGDFAITLVHELVHAMQFSRRGVRERIIRDLRDTFGVEKQTRRQAREHESCQKQEEREAYGIEHLAKQLVPGAGA